MIFEERMSDPISGLINWLTDLMSMLIRLMLETTDKAVIFVLDNWFIVLPIIFLILWFLFWFGMKHEESETDKEYLAYKKRMEKELRDIEL